MADHFLYDGDMIRGRHVNQLVVEGNVVATDVDIDYASGVKPKHAIRVNVKIGDQQTAPGKEALGMRDMMPVDFHRERDYWPTPGKQHLTAFGTYIVEDTPDNHAALVSAVRCVEDEDGNMIRQRAGCHDAKKIEAEIGCPGIVEAWRSASMVVCVIGVMMMPTLDAKPSAVIKVDRNAVTAGTYTIGSDVGNDYPTRAVAYADAAHLTGDLTFIQETAITDVATAALVIRVSPHTFTDMSDSFPAGDPTAGRLWSIDHNGHGVTLQQDAVGSFGYVNIAGVYGKRTTAGSANNRSMYRMINITGSEVIQIYKCMYDGNSLNGCGLTIADATPVCYVYNNVVWDCPDSGIEIDAALGADSSNEYQNNTVYSCGVGIEANSYGGTFKNNASYDNTTDFSNIDGATGRNNADSGGTAADGNWSVGSDNLTNQTAADDFVSLDDTNSNFLKCDTTGDLDEAGATTILSDNDTGIRETPRPNGRGSVSIGADEPLYTPPPEDDIPTSRILKKLRLI